MPDWAVIVGQCIGAILAVPSALLYTIQCAVLIRHWGKHFNNAFYKLFLLSALNNLVLNFLCSSMFGLRLNWMPALNQFFLSFPRWLCGLIFAVNYYNLHAENLLTLFMLVQRLTAILRPFDCEKIWRFLFPISAISSFALPLWPIWHLFGVKVEYYSLNNGQMALNYDHQQNLPSNSQLLFVGSTISLLLYCLINLAIFVSFKKGQSSSTTNIDSSRIEFRLLVYAIAIFIAQSLICVYWIWTYFSRLAVDNNNLWTIIFNQYVWINDLRTIVFPSWFLLWASDEMRGKVMEIVAKLMPCSKETTAITSLAQSNDGHHHHHPRGTIPGDSRILITRNTPRNAWNRH